MIGFFKKTLKKEIVNLSEQILNDILTDKKRTSNIESYGINDGNKIISEFLEHNEIELAFDHLAYVISESGVELKPKQKARFNSIEERLKK